MLRQSLTGTELYNSSEKFKSSKLTLRNHDGNVGNFDENALCEKLAPTALHQQLGSGKLSFVDAVQVPNLHSA